MSNRDMLHTRLREALAILLDVKQNQISDPNGAVGIITRPDAEERLARGKSRYVRRAINEYRDERRLGLVHTPLFSGLAALGGVLIIPMLSVLVSPSGADVDPSAAGHAIVVPLPSLTDIFNLGGKPFGLVLAAIFGLSPTVLLNLLQQEAEQYKADLKNSEPISGR